MSLEKNTSLLRKSILLWQRGEGDLLLQEGEKIENTSMVNYSKYSANLLCRKLYVMHIDNEFSSDIIISYVDYTMKKHLFLVEP